MKDFLTKYGYCHCGCGEKTNICTQNNVNRGLVKGEPSKFLPGHYSRSINIKGKNNPSWKGGKYTNDAGYIMIHMPNHSRAMSNGYVREHILLAENALGKNLPENVQIHHYGHVSDNTKLVICEDQSYHYLLHKRAQAYYVCGNASHVKCKFCQEYDDPSNNMHVKQSKLGYGWNIYHRECANKYDRERYAIKRLSNKCN